MYGGHSVLGIYSFASKAILHKNIITMLLQTTFQCFFFKLTQNRRIASYFTIFCENFPLARGRYSTPPAHPATPCHTHDTQGYSHVHNQITRSMTPQNIGRLDEPVTLLSFCFLQYFAVYMPKSVIVYPKELPELLLLFQL